MREDTDMNDKKEVFIVLVGSVQVHRLNTKVIKTFILMIGKKQIINSVLIAEQL